MKNTYNKNLVYIIAAIAATGGLLFGFDTGVISGAIPFFQKDLGIDNNMVELVTASGLIGAILGALFCGKAADRFGRKKIIVASAIVFAVGAFWSGFAPDVYHLILSRLFLGVAIGVSSFTVPLYIAEISPARSRGKLVSLFQLMITIGILASYLSDLFFADESDVACWRPMFYAGVIPALVLWIGMGCLPETPRWLMSKGREKESRSILSRIEPAESVEAVFFQLKKDIQEEGKDSSKWKDLFRSGLKIPLTIAVGIMFFQQFVGINTVIYYSPKIFLMAGFDGTVSTIGASVGVGVVNVIFTIVSVYFVDRLGRRKLYFAGLGGIILSLVSLSMFFLMVDRLGETGKWLSVLLVFLYVGFYAISIGPLGWLIVSEIFPHQVRGIGSSLGSLSVWFFNAIVSFTFFKILHLLSIPGKELCVDGETLGNPAGVFFFYSLIAVAGLAWGYYFVPETKGISLEKIERHWKEGGNARELGKVD